MKELYTIIVKNEADGTTIFTHENVACYSGLLQFKNESSGVMIGGNKESLLRKHLVFLVDKYVSELKPKAEFACSQAIKEELSKK